jgi:hypothetical protein
LIANNLIKKEAVCILWMQMLGLCSLIEKKEHMLDTHTVSSTRKNQRQVKCDP